MVAYLLSRPSTIYNKPVEFVDFTGQRLCLAESNHSAGHGTYERQGYIYSTLTGVVHLIEEDKVWNSFTHVLIAVWYAVFTIGYCDSWCANKLTIFLHCRSFLITLYNMDIIFYSTCKKGW